MKDLELTSVRIGWYLPLDLGDGTVERYCGVSLGAHMLGPVVTGVSFVEKLNEFPTCLLLRLNFFFALK